jgi:hypothetical protein
MKDKKKRGKRNEIKRKEVCVRMCG